MSFFDDIGKGVSNFLGGGGFLNSAFSFLGGEQQNRRQADAADAANAFSAQQFATRYQTTTADMKAAGLNPMLAYSQGGGSPPSGQQANVPSNSGAAAAQGFLTGKQAQLLDAQTDAASAQAAKTRAETPTSGNLGDAEIGLKGSTAALNASNLKQVDQTTAKIKQEIENMPKGNDLMSVSEWNTRILRRTAELLEQQAVKAGNEGATQEVIQNQLRAVIANLAQQTELGKLDVKAAKDLGNIGREAGQLKPLIEMIISVLRSRR